MCVAMVLGGTQGRGYILTRRVRLTVQAGFTEEEPRNPDSHRKTSFDSLGPPLACVLVLRKGEKEVG